MGELRLPFIVRQSGAQIRSQTLLFHLSNLQKDYRKRLRIRGGCRMVESKNSGVLFRDQGEKQMMQPCFIYEINSQ